MACVAVENDDLATSATDEQPLSKLVERDGYILFTQGHRPLCNDRVAEAIYDDNLVRCFVVQVDVRPVVIERHGFECVALDAYVG